MFENPNQRLDGLPSTLDPNAYAAVPGIEHVPGQTKVSSMASGEFAEPDSLHEAFHRDVGRGQLCLAQQFVRSRAPADRARSIGGIPDKSGRGERI
jgi:hypothetical protein